MQNLLIALILVLAFNLFLSFFNMQRESYHVIDEKTGKVYVVDEADFNELVKKSKEKQRKKEKNEEKKSYTEISDCNFRLFN